MSRLARSWWVPLVALGAILGSTTWMVAQSPGAVAVRSAERGWDHDRDDGRAMPGRPDDGRMMSGSPDDGWAHHCPVERER